MSYKTPLSALDGGNLLGFLATLGTFITLSESAECAGVQLEWTLSGAWRPSLVTPRRVDQEALLTVLASRLSGAEAVRPFEIATSSGDLADDLTIDPSDYRTHASQAAASGDRRLGDFAAAFGSEVVVGSKGYILDTGFRTMSGAGHQHFLGSIRELVSGTEIAHLDAALFSPWTYEDDRPTMRWDPQDDRRYALRWKEPSGDKIRTVRGANRLAIEGLRFFPVAPAGRRAVTTGFRGKGSDTIFTWPIWERPLGPDVVRSLLASSALQALGRPENDGARRALRRQGIVEIFQSRRLTRDKYRSFSPAWPV